MILRTLTNKNFQQSLSGLANKQLSARAAFKVKGVIKVVEEELKKYEEVRQATLQKYGQKDSKGDLLVNEDNSIKFETEELSKTAIKEIEELLDTPVFVTNPLPKLSLTELGDKVELSAVELFSLDELVSEN